MMAQSLPFSKWNKHVFQIFLLTILLSIPLSLQAQRFVVDGIGYEVTSTTDFTVEVIEYSRFYNPNGERLEPYSGDIIIPSTVSNEGVSYTVTGIGRDAFSGCGITSVILPSSLTSIGSWAFYRCSLTSVTIPDAVKSISYYSFADCSSLKFVSIGKSVKEIHRQAFERSPIEEIEFYCDEINDEQFYYNKSIKHVTIGDGVQKIGRWAFCGCESLESVEMSNTVTTIGFRAFSGCKKLATINLSSSLTSMGKWAFEDCKSLLSISIPSSLKTIPELAFYGCRSLTSVKIANGVTTIEESAFVGCRLDNITIPNSVTSLGEYNQEIKGKTNVEIIPVSA